MRVGGRAWFPRTMRSKRAVTVAVAALAVGVFALTPVRPATAAPMTFVVNTLNPTGPGSLDQAVLDANANPGHDLIQVMVDALGPPHDMAITDPVTIDGCVDDGDPSTPVAPKTISSASVNATFLVQAPDVRIQGLSLLGGYRPLDVTADGDRFSYAGGYVFGSSARLRVTGAEDVVIGGPADCVQATGISLLIVQGFGIELDATVDASVHGVLTTRTFGEALTVNGGSGTHIDGSDFSDALGGPLIEGVNRIPVVVLHGAGTSGSPVRITASDIHHCTSDCLVVEANSYLDFGDPTRVTTVRRNYYPESLIVITDSSAHIQNGNLWYADEPAIIVGSGSHDVVIETSQISQNFGDGILLTGDIPPTNITIRANYVGYVRTPAVMPIANLGAGVRVASSNGVVIGGPTAADGNVLSANREGGVVVDGLAARGVEIANNRIGSDPTTEQVPTVAGAPETGPYGVHVDGAPAVAVHDNIISANQAEGVFVEGAAANGVQIRHNRVGTTADGNTASPNGGTGIFVNAPSALIEDNIVAGNTAGGVFTGVAADHATVRGNRVGLQLTGGGPLPNGAHGIFVAGVSATIESNLVGGNVGDGIVASGLGSRIVGNVVGISGDFLTPRPNGEFGIRVTAPDGAVVGNTIAAQPTGLQIGSNTIVAGNRFGTQPDGTPQPGFGNGTGVDVLGDDNEIGTPANDPTLAGNTITGTGSADSAIVVHGQRNRIHANSIHLNSGHGIRMVLQVRKPNGGVRPPEGLDATIDGPALTVSGVIASDFTTGPWTVDVYASLECGPGDHEGELFLGSVTTSASTFAGSITAPPSGFGQLTFTTTDTDDDTSEFSRCVVPIDVTPPTSAAPTTEPGTTSAPTTTTGGMGGPDGTAPGGTGPDGTSPDGTVPGSSDSGGVGAGGPDTTQPATFDPSGLVLPETGTETGWLSLVAGLFLILGTFLVGLAIRVRIRAR